MSGILEVGGLTPLLEDSQQQMLANQRVLNQSIKRTRKLQHAVWISIGLAVTAALAITAALLLIPTAPAAAKASIISHTGPQKTEHCHKCDDDNAALKKEVASLKEQLVIANLAGAKIISAPAGTFRQPLTERRLKKKAAKWGNLSIVNGEWTVRAPAFTASLNSEPAL